MSPNCVEVDRIADVENLPEGHPLRQHVAGCPRCQSLWLSYQAFMQADVSGARDIDAARAALAQTIREKTGVPVPRTGPGVTRMSFSWSAWLRPAIVTAFAAMLTVVAISLWRGASDEPVLRGGEDGAWSLHAPQLSDGSIVFEWEAVSGADAYEVELFDDALNGVYTSETVTTPRVTVDRGALPSVAAGESATWRVHALREGDVISTSPPSSLTLP